MDRLRDETDIDAEGIIVGVRWLAVLFAVIQTATYYRPFPPGVEAVAWAANAVFVLAAIALTFTWLRARGPGARQSPQMSLVSLALDAAFALSLVFIYAFDAETAIFATLYIVALEGAFRFGMRGALLTTAALSIGYLAREAWAAAEYGTDFLIASVSFRMGVCLMLAIIAGGMVERYRREHRRLEVAIASERGAAVALRSLDDLRSTFLSAVSHELRTPLTSILGFALTMQDQSAELTPRTRVMLDQVVAESRHLEQLLEDLLDIERIIGLSLVDRFARLHGGRAWVESRSGSSAPAGASFRVYLPDGPTGQATVTVADEPWGRAR